ncbi:MAG TPA: dihydroneopterin aldolase [Stellaceae bacterium]|nr:dihydroneopterin aldolase [Stellaceae bacterium]
MTQTLEHATHGGEADRNLAPGMRRILIRDLVLPCEIGVLRRERGTRQRVRINLDLWVRDEPRPIEDDLSNVVCYDEIVRGVRAIVAAGHVNLVETLAERIAATCLGDQRVAGARVRVEKLEVYPDAGSVGVEIFRANSLPGEAEEAGNAQAMPVLR